MSFGAKGNKDNMDYERVAKIIGHRAIIEISSLKIEVEVLNYKQSYGKDRWLVQPVAGSGQIWMENIVMAEEGV